MLRNTMLVVGSMAMVLVATGCSLHTVAIHIVEGIDLAGALSQLGII